MKAAVSKTVMGHWPIESSNLSLSAMRMMPAGGGVLALSVSKKLLDSAGLKVGDSAEVEIQRL